MLYLVEYIQVDGSAQDVMSIAEKGKRVMLMENKKPKEYRKICVNCGKKFVTTKRKSRCCSPECVKARKGAPSRSRKQIYPCKWCGKDTENRHKKFCSIQCKDKEKESEFKGADPYGYHLSRVNSFGRRVRYHRFVMEQYLGRKLERNEVVHHIDGNKFNNDISNLRLLTNSEHAKLHYSKREKDSSSRFI